MQYVHVYTGWGWLQGNSGERMGSIAGDYYMLALCMVCVKAHSNMQVEHLVQIDVVRHCWPLWPHSLHTRQSRPVSVIATFPASGVTGGVVDRLSLQSVLHAGTSLIPFGTMCVGFCQALCYVYIRNVSSWSHTHKHIHIPMYICTRAHTHVLKAYRYISHKYIRVW